MRKKNIQGRPAQAKKWKMRKINFSHMRAKKNIHGSAEFGRAKKKTFTAGWPGPKKWEVRKINFSQVRAKKITLTAGWPSAHAEKNHSWPAG